jgi:hypothetical protein
MSGKGDGKKKSKKGGQPSRAQQQQQQAAARRSLTAPGSTPGGARTGGKVEDHPLPPMTAAAAAGQLAATDPRPPAGLPAPQVIPESGPFQPAPPEVVHYVDVAAVRIQDWLGRTPDLKFRRGGSVLLSESTTREAWDGNLPAGARWNDEAGEVDGVISLIIDPPQDGQPPHDGQDGTAEASREVARNVVRRMRAAMPHCQIQAVAGQGDSYAVAYPAMARARQDGALLVDSPPAPPELFLAKPCDQCRSAAATVGNVRVVQGEEPVDLCGECDARLEAAGRTAGRPSQAPRPERRLREALEEAGMPVADFSATFADMATAGERDRDDASTQVALIYADGNKVGAFLSRAAGTPGGPDKAEIAPLLDRAVLGALAQAVIDRFRGWPEPPVLVHLAGGDDLLVSVPAADAWLFSKTLLVAFTSILAEKAAGWPESLRQQVPALAAGLVFHHVKTPFSDVVRLAGEQLRVAKAKTRGGAAVAFLDMTADGNQPPDGRAPVTLADLDRHADRFQQVADMPGSRRQALLDLYRNGDIEGFIARLTDFPDNRPLWEIAAGPRAATPDVRDVLRKNEQRRHDVRRALDIARHWRAEPRAPHSRGTEGSEASR